MIASVQDHRPDIEVMTEMALALGSFVLAHLIPPLPPVRARLLALLGRPAYLALYSLLSLVLLAWILMAAARAPYMALWTPGAGHYLVPVLVMPVAAWLAVAGLLQCNPFSLTLRRSPPETPPGAVTAVTRQPVLWAVLLWALSHIPPNGDLAGLVLFAFMALLAAGGLVSLDRRARRRLGEKHWRQLAQATSLMPFAAFLDGRVPPARLLPLLLPGLPALALYAWFLLHGHAMLVGVDPLAGVIP